jgi:hypothetical protein
VVGNIILKPLPKESPEKKADTGGVRLIQLNKIEVDDSLPVPVYDFLLRQAEQEECNLYGIVDSARNEDVFRYLITGGTRYKSLFEGTMDEQSYGVSGFLVECKKESPLFKWMTTEAWGDSCCIFFTSKASFDDLFRHFQKFNRVYLEGDEVVLFRYYDPRVLKTYLPTCTKAEIDLFFGQIENFYTENKNPEIMSVFKKNKSNDEFTFSIKNVKIFINKDISG